MNRIKILILSLLFFHFSFPKDHSFHSDFGLEWCYFVGHIESDTGNLYGYELSFFRLKFSDDSDWNPEVFPVHFAISDFSSKKYKNSQTIKRTIGGLSGYSDKVIFSGTYRLEIISKDKFHIQAQSKSKDLSLDFELEGNGKILVHGKDGVSIKSNRNPNIFSYYYSYPRLKTKGILFVNGKRETIVSGNSWMDHEWSEKNSKSIPSLATGETGWDWICLSDNLGGDYVFFRFRESHGLTPEIFGTHRNPEGKTTYWKEPGQIQMETVGSFWKSPDTKIEYPLHWKIKYPGGEWNVSPIFNEQEFDGSKTTSTIYWEGGVDAIDPIQKKSAKGYLELKGYKKPKEWWEF
ncbi:carotenoid 1,2-hydratase [Leptospira vanthielii]|uniref:Hydroxyneurosporene synthase CrtC n=1 Tax=Leptospira vanthielii serovar Holland str. Waz Holland = ATCC 700522 TaxID=1218591 RepID=N1W5A7_9LEPT|nr:carotenoid 1,2-hydratase [Leptospira vanthielii]EMY71439.1 hydroxyneurosporene synthase CrtC [Leptospira vanthielii serovar Holland str. Waz Holland = ATCC 700522]